MKLFFFLIDKTFMYIEDLDQISFSLWFLKLNKFSYLQAWVIISNYWVVLCVMVWFLFVLGMFFWPFPVFLQLIYVILKLHFGGTGSANSSANKTYYSKCLFNSSFIQISSQNTLSAVF